MNYYDAIAEGYDNLHKEEQFAKFAVIKDSNIIKENDRLLDVGCGTGFSLDYFSVKESVGIDPSQGLIDQYKGKQSIMKGCAEDLPFEDNSFDIIISVTAIQNFSNIKQGLSEMKRVGRDRFVITILKRSLTTKLTRKYVKAIFEGFTIKEIEEEKDIIFLITKEK
ncbi:MAG: class I SAM-dependent methyltransferase [Nanobdellota archaeon]